MLSKHRVSHNSKTIILYRYGTYGAYRWITIYWEHKTIVCPHGCIWQVTKSFLYCRMKRKGWRKSVEADKCRPDLPPPLPPHHPRASSSAAAVYSNSGQDVLFKSTYESNPRSRYRVFIKYCFFPKNFRMLATSPSPELGCYWLYKKLTANRSDCTIALCWELWRSLTAM